MMCKWGTHEKVKLMEINLQGYTLERHKKRAKKLGLEDDEEFIDSCIASLVQVLNDGGIKTTSSCCGHGKTFGEIWLQERVLLIINDRDKYRSNKHKYLIKMVIRHIFGSYKIKYQIRKNNMIWRLKKIIKKKEN